MRAIFAVFIYMLMAFPLFCFVATWVDLLLGQGLWWYRLEFDSKHVALSWWLEQWWQSLPYTALCALLASALLFVSRNLFQWSKTVAMLLAGFGALVLGFWFFFENFALLLTISVSAILLEWILCMLTGHSRSARFLR